MAVNLISNGGFETGDFTDWHPIASWSGFAVTSEHIHSGTFSCVLNKYDPYNTLMSFNSNIYTIFSIPSSGLYTLSFWYYIEDVTIPTGGTLSITVKINTDTILILSSETTGWVKFTSNIQLEPNNYHFGIYLSWLVGSTPGIGCNAYFDDVQVIEYVEPSVLTSLYNINLRQIITDSNTPLNYPVEVTIMGQAAWVRIDWSDDYSETIITGF